MKVRAELIHAPAEPHLVPDIRVELTDDDDGDRLVIPDIFYSAPSRSVTEDGRSFQGFDFNSHLGQKIEEAVFSVYGQWQWDLRRSKKKGSA